MITLGIIGVVAALTIPSLIENYQKRQAVSQLKVAYSLLSQAVNQSVAKNGEINSWDYSLSYEDFNKKYIMPYLKVVKVLDKCKGSSCQQSIPGNFIQYSYILSNGMIIVEAYSRGFINFIVDINGDKGKNEFGKDIFWFYLLHHNIPNDTERRIVSQYPPGLYIGSYGNIGVPQMSLDRDVLIKNSCTKENPNKQACAAVIAKDGWKIKNDYPWK